MTAAPLFVSEDCRLGAAPTAPVRVKPGSYLVLVRSAKHAEQRLPVSVRRGATLELKTRLLPAAARPEGFVFVPARGDEPGFWIMEREVTAGEYLAFLNDAPVQARITASDKTILVPRSPQSPPGGDWPRGADGRYSLPERFEADFPAFGISWHDAQAYVAWRCVRDGRAYVLPTGQHWERAGRGAFEWKYPYGHRFEPKWAKSCFSRRKAWLEPVLSYPVDEAACGAFDMSGSVGEWLDAWWGDPVNRLRPFGGGSWAHAAPHFFRVPGGNGIAPHMAYWMFGLRLVLPGEEPEAEEKR